MDRYTFPALLELNQFIKEDLETLKSRITDQDQLDLIEDALTLLYCSDNIINNERRA